MHREKGSGTRRRGGGPRAAERTAFRREVDRLVREMGLERPLAVRVARDELSLSDAVAAMARRDRVASLVRRHGFSKALASQIALGQADLEYHLRKQRLEAHLAEHRDTCTLEAAAASGELLGLGLHGERQVRARVSAVERYEVVLARDGREEREHKLQLQYALPADGMKKLGRARKWNRELRGPREPIPRPQDRFALSDRRLFAALDQDLTVELTLLEGEVLRGQLQRLSRYEVALRLKGRLDVVVFRHAVTGFSQA